MNDDLERDLNEYYFEQTEAELEEDVKHYWRATRDPHRLLEEVGGGYCPCHEMHVDSLRHAIKRLRAFRRGVYWA
jgi:hypothetical protein